MPKATAIVNARVFDGTRLRDWTSVRFAGGTITDTSFIGVSTQYLVKMPWGEELTVFEQNTGDRTVFGPGTSVDLHWSRPHTFVLDAEQDATAGVETVDDAP